MLKKLVLSIKRCATGIKHTHTLSLPQSTRGTHTHTHTLIKHTLVTATFHLTRRHVVVGQVMMMRQAGILQNNQLGSESAESGCVLTGSVPRLGRSVPKKHDRCTSEEDINTHTRSNKAQLKQWRKKKSWFLTSSTQSPFNCLNYIFRRIQKTTTMWCGQKLQNELEGESWMEIFVLISWFSSLWMSLSSHENK